MLSGNNLSNVLIVVTRYFGGILLGTGGLIRAYTGALSNAIEISEFEEKELGLEILIEVSYSDLEKLKYYCKIQEIKISSIEYSENIKVTLEMSKEKYKNIESNKNELNFVINEIHVVREKYITL
jgi:putative IMPACT (imprinted ancient) family translation regulator